MTVLYNTLDANKSTGLKGYKSAKNIWDKLCEIHEDSQDIKEQRNLYLLLNIKLLKWNLMTMLIRCIVNLV